jgi:hypothetical protein
MKDALRKFSLTFWIVVGSMLSAWAQQDQQFEMADVLRRDGKIYTVVISLMVVITGLIVLLVRIDRRVERLEKE